MEEKGKKIGIIVIVVVIALVIAIAIGSAVINKQEIADNTQNIVENNVEYREPIEEGIVGSSN